MVPRQKTYVKNRIDPRIPALRNRIDPTGTCPPPTHEPATAKLVHHGIAARQGRHENGVVLHPPRAVGHGRTHPRRGRSGVGRIGTADVVRSAALDMQPGLQRRRTTAQRTTTNSPAPVAPPRVPISLRPAEVGDTTIDGQPDPIVELCLVDWNPYWKAPHLYGKYKVLLQSNRCFAGGRGLSSGPARKEKTGRRRTRRLSELKAKALAAGTALTPSGFIFHMSRVGSTLAANILSSAPQWLVYSEGFRMPSCARNWCSREQKVAMLRDLVLYGFGASSSHQALYFKFQSAISTEMDLLLEVTHLPNPRPALPPPRARRPVVLFDLESSRALHTSPNPAGLPVHAMDIHVPLAAADHAGVGGRQLLRRRAVHALAEKSASRRVPNSARGWHRKLPYREPRAVLRGVARTHGRHSARRSSA